MAYHLICQQNLVPNDFILKIQTLFVCIILSAALAPYNDEITSLQISRLLEQTGSFLIGVRANSFFIIDFYQPVSKPLKSEQPTNDMCIRSCNIL